MMDIQKEKKAIKNLKAFYMEDWNLTEEERDDLDNLVSRIVAVVKTEAQAVPEGFVLVPKELPESIAEAMALEYVEKPIHETDPIWIKISEDAYKSRLQSKKWEFWRDYKTMIEAAQGEAHD